MPWAIRTDSLLLELDNVQIFNDNSGSAAFLEEGWWGANQ